MKNASDNFMIPFMCFGMIIGFIIGKFVTYDIGMYTCIGMCVGLGLGSIIKRRN